MKTYSWLILLPLTLCSAALYAGETNLLTISSLFAQMDSDKDGVIKRNEINKHSLLSNEFNNVDKNRDGALDPREFEIFIVKADI